MTKSVILAPFNPDPKPTGHLRIGELLIANFTFTGNVTPEHVPLSIDYSPKVSISNSEICGDAVFTGSISDGIAKIIVETADNRGWEGLHYYANDLCRSMTDLASIREGVAWQCTLSEVLKPDGSREGIILADRKLALAARHFRQADYEQLFEIVLPNTQISRLISDASVMLSWSHYAPIAAGRIVDGLVRLVSGGRSSSHWEQFRSALRVERSWLEFVTERAVAPRHGDRRYVPGPENNQLAHRTWVLLDRFMALRLYGELDPAEFPVLTDQV